ncbi:Uma2 family endonuclease [Saccharopolyspora dendranthemae]|uniref:Uma2 family endonuclease n=2 Tax=Saccharopolyspora dendranthemae TaxID=1181886 RepID=A0A561U4R5_9PSEU|nr:Uma2 family endonuclease [Saccharopolyspora dendranthemae]
MTWPDHLMTLAEFDVLPEDNSRRYELQEGVLQATPKAISYHQLAIKRLTHALDQVLPEGWTSLPEAEIVLTERYPPTVRIPDVVVMSEDRAEEGIKLYGQDVALAVEVLSPGTQRVDNLVKRAEYAEAGIPAYWILDVESRPKLTANVLVDGVYKEIFNGTGVFMTERPFDLRVDLDVLRKRAGSSKRE